MEDRDSYTLLLLLLLLAAMTYNQVQSFQINDYANHYVDIEITGYRALYSKSIAGRGVARLMHLPLSCPTYPRLGNGQDW